MKCFKKDKSISKNSPERQMNYYLKTHTQKKIELNKSEFYSFCFFKYMYGSNKVKRKCILKGVCLMWSKGANNGIFFFLLNQQNKIKRKVNKRKKHY